MLWREWFKVVIQLKTSCSRNRTFIWLVIVLVGMSVRSDLYGVTSFVRAGFVESKHYKSLLNMFHSKALQLDILLTLWVKMSLTLFNPVTVDGYIYGGKKKKRELVRQIEAILYTLKIKK